MIGTLNIDKSVELLQDGNNYKVKSEYAGHFNAPIIKALSDGKYINPILLNGKRVLIVIKDSVDRSSHNTKVILLFHKSEYTDYAEPFSICKVSCKCTYAGSAISVENKKNAIVDVACFSNGEGTHWDVIISGLNLEYDVRRKFKGNLEDIIFHFKK